MADTVYRCATRNDDVTLKHLLQENPMPSWVTIATEREPSYFDGASLMGESYALIVYDSAKEENLIGMYSCSYLPVHYEGKPQRIGYFGGLRVTASFRHKHHYIKYGFEAIKQIIPRRATVPFYFTSIASENTIARRLLEANTKGMPHYTPVGEMVTLIFSVNQGKNLGQLIQATIHDCADIVAYYNQKASLYDLSPYLSVEWLRALSDQIGLRMSDFWLLKNEHQKIVACLALWDQRAFKQSVIKGYKAPLNHLRSIYNGYAKMTKRVALPPVGKPLDHLYIAFFAYDDPTLALKVLQEAAYKARAKGVTCCVLGLSSSHELLPMLTRTLKPERYQTHIEIVTLNGDDDYTPISPNPVQPEVALL